MSETPKNGVKCPNCLNGQLELRKGFKLCIECSECGQNGISADLIKNAVASNGTLTLTFASDEPMVIHNSIMGIEDDIRILEAAGVKMRSY